MSDDKERNDNEVSMIGELFVDVTRDRVSIIEHWTLDVTKNSELVKFDWWSGDEVSQSERW